MRKPATGILWHLWTLAENSGNIFSIKFPLFRQASGSMIVYPSNDVNRLYEQLTTSYGMIRDVDKVTNAFDPLYPGFQIGRDFEKIENARKLDDREYEF